MNWIPGMEHAEDRQILFLRYIRKQIASLEEVRRAQGLENMRAND